MIRSLMRYEWGMGLALGAILVQLLLGLFLAWDSYQIFLAVVAISAIRAGKENGAVALALSAVSKCILFLLPAYPGHMEAKAFADRMLTFLVMGSALAWIGGTLHEAAQRQRELLERARLLTGFLPICAGCKRIRDDDGRWCQLETYISSHSDAQFSHGYCPRCAALAYQELERS